MSDIISVSPGLAAGSKRTILKSLKFTFLSYIISLVLLAIVAALVVYTNIPESISGTAVSVITLFGAFLSSFLTCRGISSKGWLFGFLTGAFNIAFLFFLGTFLTSESLFTVSKLLFTLYGGLCGAAGGIIGVNLGKN